MAGSSPLPTRRGFRRGLTELLFSLRTAAHTPVLQSLSVGMGVVIGCLPIYGLHLGACILVNRMFRLNLIKMYLATNINNPFSAPFLVYFEIQVGSFLRQGKMYEHTVETARSLNLRDFLFDIVVGSLTVGLLLGTVFALLTFFAVRRIYRTPAMADLVDQTGRRYLDAGLLYWEFSRVCLRIDPFFRKIFSSNVLPESGSLLHIGCGRGLVLTFLDVATRSKAGESEPEPDLSLSLSGVDDNTAKVKIARQALGGRARVDCEGIEAYDFGSHDVVINLDQFRSADRQERDTLLRRAAKAVNPGGLLIVRASTAQPLVGLWPFTVLTESRVVDILEDEKLGFTTDVLYRSLRRAVVLARRPESGQI